MTTDRLVSTIKINERRVLQAACPATHPSGASQQRARQQQSAHSWQSRSLHTAGPEVWERTLGQCCHTQAQPRSGRRASMHKQALAPAAAGEAAAAAAVGTAAAEAEESAENGGQ